MVGGAFEGDSVGADPIGACDSTNDCEVVRDLVCREPQRLAQIDALRAALFDGENSGAPLSFDIQAFKARMTASGG